MPWKVLLAVVGLLSMTLLHPVDGFVSLARKLPHSMIAQNRHCIVQKSSLAAAKLTALERDAKAWSPHGLCTQPTGTPDFLAPLNYVAATGVQWGLVYLLLRAVQTKILPLLPGQIHEATISFFSFFISVRTRLFSPLDNNRPMASTSDKVFQRLKPWWQPPPIFFAIIWSTIALLRTAATVTVFKTTGTLLCEPVYALVLHLCIGDTWNTINNVEGRLGTSAATVPLVFGSAVWAALLYNEITPLAGNLLAPMVTWLGVATCLINSIWRLNRRAQPSALFPTIEEGPRARWLWPCLPSMLTCNNGDNLAAARI